MYSSHSRCSYVNLIFNYRLNALYKYYLKCVLFVILSFSLVFQQWEPGNACFCHYCRLFSIWIFSFACLSSNNYCLNCSWYPSLYMRTWIFRELFIFWFFFLSSADVWFGKLSVTYTTNKYLCAAYIKFHISLNCIDCSFYP